MSGVLALIPVVALTYLAVGVVVGVWYVFARAGRVDAGAARASLRVKLVFVPGAAAVWPLLLVGSHGSHEGQRSGEALRSRHALTWFALAPVLVIGVVVLILFRPPPAGDSGAGPAGDGGVAGVSR